MAALGSLLALVGVVTVNGQLDPELDGPFPEARRFTIQPGKTWAGPLLRRVRFWGLPTDRSSWDFRVRFDVSETPIGTSFKIIGLSDLSGRSNRVDLYGADQADDLAHEDSDRFVGSVTEVDGIRGVRIGAYAYRSGYGGISGSRGVTIPDSIPPLSHALGFLPDGEWAVLRLKREEAKATYLFWRESLPVDSAVTHTIPMTHAPSPVQERWSGFAHAASGRRQPNSPGRIRLELAMR